VTWRIRPLLPLALALGIIGTFAWLFFRQASELYVMDESDFAGVARAIAHTGRPIYYRGEDLPHYAGIWHPPLYQYTSGLWVWTFGTSHTAFRSYGFFCALLAASLGWLILRRLFPRSMPWLGVGWLAVFLWHPYVIQSALLPDIDSTALVVTSMLSLWLVTETVVARRWRPLHTSLLFGVALGLGLLAKLTTPLGLIPLFAIALLLATRSIFWTVVGSALSVLVGAATFATIWGAISGAANLSFTYPFNFTWDSVVSRGGTRTFADRLDALWPVQSVTYWLTPILILLVCIGVLTAFWAVRSREGQAVLLVALFTATVFFTYNVVTRAPFGFPKYYAPATGPAAIVALAPFGFLEPSAKLEFRRNALASSLVGATVALLLLGACYVTYAGRADDGIFPAWSSWFLLAVGVTTAISLGFLIGPRGRSARWFGLGLTCWLAAVATLTFTNTSKALYQRSDPANVRYYPGERDFSLTAEKVRQLLIRRGGERSARLLSAKDIGYESGVRYYEDAGYLGRPKLLAKVMREHRDMLIVTRSQWDYSEPLFPQGFAVIRRLAEPLWLSPHGSFTIWKRSGRE
jgi:4-amino-4-deoxy-L-arabinose transferase-like glycosyltransferase